jgi:hypothetical protein
VTRNCPRSTSRRKCCSYSLPWDKCPMPETAILAWERLWHRCANMQGRTWLRISDREGPARGNQVLLWQANRLKIDWLRAPRGED